MPPSVRGAQGYPHMHGLTAGTAVSWNNRNNRDTDERRAARTAVEGLKPAVVITGGSRGIGLAFARVFLEWKHPVVLVARNEFELAAAAKSLMPLGGEVHTLTLDVTSDRAPEKIDEALARFGCYLDIVVNNAATGLSGNVADYSADDLDALVQLNVAALTRLTRNALPAMIARGDGGILNIASLGGAVPGPNQAAYYASKAYVMSLTEALASEASGKGVRISVVAPGPVATVFHAAMHAEAARYRTLLPELTADQVARSGYRGFTLGQRVIVPGILYRIFYFWLRVLPHPISVPLTGWLLKNPK
jgi:uncharacterized protein